MDYNWTFQKYYIFKNKIKFTNLSYNLCIQLMFECYNIVFCIDFIRVNKLLSCSLLWIFTQLRHWSTLSTTRTWIGKFCQDMRTITILWYNDRAQTSDSVHWWRHAYRVKADQGQQLQCHTVVLKNEHFDDDNV